MILKIYILRSACHTLNELYHKVEKNMAEVVYTGNMTRPPHGVLGPELFVKKLFKTYESNSGIHPNTRNLAFHLSINPGEGDNMSLAKTIQFAKEYMQEMGFGTQPYVIFFRKDPDTKREFYHLICPLVDANGKVIFYRQHGNNNLIYTISREITERLAPRFGFIVGKLKDATVNQQTATIPCPVSGSTDENDAIHNFMTESFEEHNCEDIFWHPEVPDDYFEHDR